MKLEEFFRNCCRELAKNYNCELLFKDLLRTAKSKTADGIAARFTFDGFYIDINFLRKCKISSCRDLLWISVNFADEKAVPFSVYDLLGYFEIKDFRCFTPTYISTEELMAQSFVLLSELFTGLVPFIKFAVQNGVIKNKITEQQKKYISDFCGSDILYDATVNATNMTEKLVYMLISGFTSFEISEAVSGGQSLFYKGKLKKAQKYYKKKKYKNTYDLMLEEYIKKGGTAPENTLAKDIEKSKKENTKTERKKLIYTLFSASIINIPVSLLAYGLYYVLSGVMFKDAIFISGVDFANGAEAIIGAFPLSLCIALHIIPKIKNKTEKPKITTALRYFTAFSECLFLMFCFTAANSSAVFYEDYFTYGSKDILNINRQQYSYEQIDEIIRVENVYDETTGEYINRPYYVFKLKSGRIVDLFNSTNGHTENIEEKLLIFLNEKGIENKKTEILTIN